MHGFKFKLKNNTELFCPRQKIFELRARNVFTRTRNSLPITSDLPTVHIVTTAHHMEWGMEMKWLRGLSSSILNRLITDMLLSDSHLSA